MGKCGWLGLVLAGGGGGRTGNAVAEEEDPQLFSVLNPELAGCVWACVNEGMGVERGSRGAATEAEAFPLSRTSESSSNVTHCCLRVSGTGAGGATAGTGAWTWAGMGMRGVSWRVGCLEAKADVVDMVLWKAKEA